MGNHCDLGNGDLHMTTDLQLVSSGSFDERFAAAHRRDAMLAKHGHDLDRRHALLQERGRMLDAMERLLVERRRRLTSELMLLVRIEKSLDDR
jgi:hypothetical protein